MGEGVSKVDFLMVRRICFDLETEPFSEEFRVTDDRDIRLKIAPKMRVACTFDGKVWSFFLPSEADELIKHLQTADELISYFGSGFDELVLRRHYKLSGHLPKSGRHIDICSEIESRCGRVSLHDMAQLNFGEKKHISGRRMDSLDIEALKKACRSDVWQTYRLWELWAKNKLKFPPRRIFESHSDDRDMVGPGHHEPSLCPFCHSVNSLEFIDQDTDEMSEGQAADYKAGMFGTSICKTCNNEVHWD